MIIIIRALSPKKKEEERPKEKGQIKKGRPKKKKERPKKKLKKEKNKIKRGNVTFSFSTLVLQSSTMSFI